MDRRRALSLMGGVALVGMSRTAVAAPQSVKAVVVGASGAGKTCLLIRYVTHDFPGAYVPGVFDNYSANVTVDGRQYMLGLWDTSGKDDADRVRPLAYPNADVFVIAFSVVSTASFNDVKQRWVPEVKHHMPTTPFVLVGLKTDARDDAAVLAALKSKGESPITTAQGQTLAKEVAASTYYECSALKDVGVSAVFQGAIKTAMRVGSKRTRTPR